MTAMTNHPCFDIHAKKKYARVHLPVAPKCNIQCGYCDRKYDCVNESRPGVTSAVLAPHQALAYFRKLNSKIPNISVVGIAGPGDPFANPEETLETMRLIKEEFPDKIFCLSTNGLGLYPYIEEINEIGVSHVTLTINALDPEILKQVYRWARHDKKVYQRQMAGEILLEQQLKCLKKLKELDVTVKINTIVLPGVNDHHIETLAAKVAEMGADTMNCIPVYPNKDTDFENIEEPTPALMKELKEKVSKYIKPMTHCARCRADAAGMLGKDDPEAMELLQEHSKMPLLMDENKTRVAVGTNEGMLVNQHLGESDELYVFEETKNGYKLIEQRKTPVAGTGDDRWLDMCNILNDCKAVLVGGAGPRPTKILHGKGIKVIQMTGLIDHGLDHVFKGTELKATCKADNFKCGSSCSGNAQGCA